MNIEPFEPHFPLGLRRVQQRLIKTRQIFRAQIFQSNTTPSSFFSLGAALPWLCVCSGELKDLRGTGVAIHSFLEYCKNAKAGGIVRKLMRAEEEKKIEDDNCH